MPTLLQTRKAPIRCSAHYASWWRSYSSTAAETLRTTLACVTSVMCLALIQALAPGCIRQYDDFDGRTSNGQEIWTPEWRENDGPWEDESTADVCSPDCSGKECGGDGCGGSCGTCHDGNLCTDDLCNVGMECIYPPNTLPCNDDGNPCTTDVCDNSACHHKPASNIPCDDSNVCTDGDACISGQCKAGAAKNCDDGDDCTKDTCNPATGCEHTKVAPCCGDGLCDNGETCEDCPVDCGACPGQCAPSCDPTLEECIQATTGGWVCTSTMVAIPAGNFWMGCNSCAGSMVNDASCGDDEHPYHEVYLDAYEIDRTEVTAAQYLVCKNTGGCSAASTGNYATYEVPGKENHPVNHVDWSQAEDYCLWVGKHLCTEAQWEKGARGGCEKNGGPSNCKAQSRKYPWGNETPTCDLAVKAGCDGDTQPVCSASPKGDSPYGLCDMAGNVWEWTADWYKKDYYCDGDGASGNEYCTKCGSWPGSPNAWSNPFCTIGGSDRVVRGGSFLFPSVYLRVSYRFDDGSSDVGGYLGVRCCRSE